MGEELWVEEEGRGGRRGMGENRRWRCREKKRKGWGSGKDRDKAGGGEVTGREGKVEEGVWI